MIILGIDPGSEITGFGTIECSPGGEKLLGFGTIRADSGSCPLEKLNKIYTEVKGKISKYNPDKLAIEDVFCGKNPKATLRLGEVRGVVLLAATQLSIPVVQYPPREIKKAVVGIGSASKQQVQFMTKELLGLKNDVGFFDTTDALAVALCCAHRLNKQKAF